MIRTAIAAMLLRSTGAKLQFKVQRISHDENSNAKLRTLSTLPTLKEARKRFRDVRAADTDTIVIQIEATVAQRHGKAVAS